MGSIMDKVFQQQCITKPYATRLSEKYEKKDDESDFEFVYNNVYNGAGDST